MSKHILVVDDDLELLELTVTHLKKHGYTVSTAVNGIKALEEIQGQQPDLILADVLMPEMDGFTLYKSLKADQLTANIPVLIITGRGKMEDSFQVLGVDGFIAKPFTPQGLLEEIEHILGQSEVRSSVETEKLLGGSAKRILAVSNQSNILNSMVQQAERCGYEILPIATASEAIARCVKFRPAVTFIDVGLRDMSASELTDILRRLPNMDQKNIIGFSYYPTEGLDDPSLRQRILGFNEESKQMIKSGADEFMGRYTHQLFVKTLTDDLLT